MLERELKCNVPKRHPNRGQPSPHVLKSLPRLVGAAAELRGECVSIMDRNRPLFEAQRV